jgi:hypothetical protein
MTSTDQRISRRLWPLLSAAIDDRDESERRLVDELVRRGPLLVRIDERDDGVWIEALVRTPSGATIPFARVHGSRIGLLLRADGRLTYEADPMLDADLLDAALNGGLDVLEEMQDLEVEDRVGLLEALAEMGSGETLLPGDADGITERNGDSIED